MDLPPIPERSPTGRAESPLASPGEDELINHLMHGPVSAPTLCRYGHEIVQMPDGHWRLATRDQSVDRIACAASDDGRHHPAGLAHIELPIQAGDPCVLGLPQETGGAA